MPWIRIDGRPAYETDDVIELQLLADAGVPLTEYCRARAWKRERASVRRGATLLAYRSAIAIRELNDRVRDLCERLRERLLVRR